MINYLDNVIYIQSNSLTTNTRYIEVCCWSRQTPIKTIVNNFVYNEFYISKIGFIEEISNPRGIISIEIYYVYIELSKDN